MIRVPSSSSTSVQTIDGSRVIPFESKGVTDDLSVGTGASSNPDDQEGGGGSKVGKIDEHADEDDEDHSSEGGHDDFQHIIARRPPQIFEIDFIGGDTFRVSQTNLLKIKSIEPNPDSHAMLSARGLTHRSRENFQRELRNANQIIGATKISKGHSQPIQLFQSYFRRALAYERLNQINKAIKDYTHCIQINPTCSESFFNRSGLYQLKGRSQEAIKDLNEAIGLEPLNANYRRNRSLLLRETGMYKDAVADSKICKMLDKKAKGGVYKDVTTLEEEETLFEEDPIIVALQLNPRRRSLYHLIPIVEFIQSMKMFANLTAAMMSKMAGMFTLNKYDVGESVFCEGDVGDRFYVVLEGEIAIYKNIITKNMFGDDLVDSKTLVVLMRGQSFGETALESEAGLRTAGARATGVRNASLMVLTAEQYRSTLNQFKSAQNSELLRAMTSCSVFKHWDAAKVETLAVHCIERGYSADIELLRAGDLCRYLFIIKCGIVKIVKRIPKPARPSPQNTLPRLQNLRKGNLEEPPGLWILGHRDSERGNAEQIMRQELEGKGRRGTRETDSRSIDNISGGTSPTGKSIKSKALPNLHDFSEDGGMVDFNVGVLGSGQIFGEMCILQPDTPSPATVISCTGAEVYCFEKDIMLSMGIKYDSASIMALDESLRLHDPPVDKIQYFYRSKYEWEQRKKAALKNLKLA